MVAALVCVAAPSALGATVEVRCPGMPLTVEEDLWARASRLLADSARFRGGGPLDDGLVLANSLIGVPRLAAEQ